MDHLNESGQDPACPFSARQVTELSEKLRPNPAGRQIKRFGLTSIVNLIELIPSDSRVLSDQISELTFSIS